VIVTDQSKEWKVTQIETVIGGLHIPATVIIGVERQKPDTSLFLDVFPDFLEKEARTAFYVGDAAGRKGDWSDKDRVFAERLGVEFNVPEDFFPRGVKKIEPSKNESPSTNKTEVSKMNYSKMKKDELKALCKERKIKGITGKSKEELIEMITQRDTTPSTSSKIEAGIGNEQVVKVEMSILPSWYKIPEINKEIYLLLVKPLYDIIEGKKLSKSEPDVFAQQAWMLFHNIKKEEWESEHMKIQIERAWTMAWGNFHQNLMGSFPGWKNYEKGHTTGCDIGKEDDTCVGEIKNNTNTMNSSSKESVLKKLKKQKELGKRALLVVINGDIKKSVKDGIETISGRQFYEELSGRPTFIDDLLSTTNESFRQYKTFDSLKIALEIV
jgi:hypothetical protein